MTGDEYKTVWVSTCTDSEKKWGLERTIGSLSTVQAKILFINEGHSTSLKYYTTKNEVLYVKSGEILVEYDSEKYHYQEEESRRLKSKTLCAGDVLFVQSQCPYRITALRNSEIFEIGDSRAGSKRKIEET